MNGLPFHQRECCKVAEKLDSVVPLKFKKEFVGTRGISLCSKTYIIEGRKPGEFKMAAKGLSRKSNEISWQHFLQCLTSQRNCVGRYEGIQKWKRDDNAVRMCTVAKTQNVLTCFYAKRLVDR